MSCGCPFIPSTLWLCLSAGQRKTSCCFWHHEQLQEQLSADKQHVHGWHVRQTSRIRLYMPMITLDSSYVHHSFPKSRNWLQNPTVSATYLFRFHLVTFCCCTWLLVEVATRTSYWLCQWNSSSQSIDSKMWPLSATIKIIKFANEAFFS